MAQRGKCGSTRKSPDWGLNPGPPGYILGALTTELYGPEYRVLVSDSYQLCDRLLIQQIGVLFGWMGQAGLLLSGGVGWVCPVSTPQCGWVGVVKDSVCSVGGAKGISTSWFTTWGSFVPADMWWDGDDGGVRDTSLKWAGILKHGGIPLGLEGG